MHKHTITATTITSADFKVTGKTSTRTYYGTAIISMKEGPVSNVPIVIKLLSDGSMSIMPDPIRDKGSLWKYSNPRQDQSVIVVVAVPRRIYMLSRSVKAVAKLR